MDPIEILTRLSRAVPTSEDVGQARARRAPGGTPRPGDVLLDRFGTGQEMGLIGIPVAAAYEATKPALAASPTLNELLGKLAGPEQMVDETTQRPSFGEALMNVGATTAGALSETPIGKMLLRAFRQGSGT